MNTINLTSGVLDKIKELGPTKSAAYFGVSVPTTYAWKKKPASIPVSAVEKVLNENPSAGFPEREVPDPAPPPSDTSPEPTEGELMDQRFDAASEVSPDVVPGEQALPTNEADVIRDVLGRLSKIENWIRTQFDPQRNQPRTSMVAPLGTPMRQTVLGTASGGRQPRSTGIIVKSKPEVLSGPRQAAPRGALWNQPVGKKAGVPKWNNPIRKVESRNKPGDWNRPVLPKKQD